MWKIVSSKSFQACLPSSSKWQTFESTSISTSRNSTKAFFEIPRRLWFLPISFKTLIISSIPPCLPRQSTAVDKTVLWSLQFETEQIHRQNVSYIILFAWLRKPGVPTIFVFVSHRTIDIKTCHLPFSNINGVFWKAANLSWLCGYRSKNMNNISSPESKGLKNENC